MIAATRAGLHEITSQVQEVVQQSGLASGLCHLFLQHTSASLLIQENADPTAARDLEEFLHRLARRESHLFRHTAEGEDDMPAHIKTALTQVNLSIPILEQRLALGTWQGIYLFEHRQQCPPRRLLVSVFG